MATRKHKRSLTNIMFMIVFILTSQTVGDWVEISQNHYRKEPPRKVNANNNFEETTKAVIVYRNNSLLDQHWKKGVIDRVPNIANVRRVNVPSVKMPSRQIENNLFNRQNSFGIIAQDERYDSVLAKPNILSKYHEEEIPIDPRERFDEPYHGNRGSTFGGNSEPMILNEAHTSNSKPLSRIESVSKGYITIVKKENLNQDTDSVRSTSLKSPENKVITTQRTQITKNQEEIKVDFNHKGHTDIINERLLPKDSKSKGISNIVKPIVQSILNDNPISEKPESIIKGTEADSGRVTIKKHKIHIKNQNESDETKESKEYDNKEAKKGTNFDGISNNTKGSTVNTMWKLIKVVTDSIYKSTRKSFKSKINYLESLKSNILFSIEDQIERTWPDDSARSSRSARDASARGHVEFPSSESALMSISFLTFAVFLIKLVLQVIHTYKNKTMMVTPAVVTAVGRAAAAMTSKN